MFNSNLQYNKESDFYYKKIMQKFHNKIEFLNLENSVERQNIQNQFLLLVFQEQDLL